MDGWLSKVLGSLRAPSVLIVCCDISWQFVKLKSWQWWRWKSKQGLTLDLLFNPLQCFGFISSIILSKNWSGLWTYKKTHRHWRTGENCSTNYLLVCLAITIVPSLLTRIWDHRYGVTLRSENKYRDSTLSWWFCASPYVVQGLLSCWRHPRSDHTEVSVRHLFCTYFCL